MMNTIFDLNHFGLISVSGQDAKRFLQGQLTCNLEEITPLQSCLGAHCTPQGRVISLFHLFLYQDCYFLQMPRELIPIALKALQKYAVFFKVKLTDTYEELALLGYEGDELANMPQQVNSQCSTEKWTCIRLPGIAARYQFFGEQTAILALFNAQKQSGSIDQWKALDITESIPSIYPETSGKFLPHELNLPALNAVSFNKGCYTGQEIIARMQYRGKLKTHLYQAKITTEQTIIRGTDIYSHNKSCGSIVDYTQIDYNRYLLLIITQATDVENGKISLDMEEKHFLEF